MAKWQRTKIEIPKEYSPRERKAIALEIIEFIKNRTSKGKDKNNENFAKYSKGYKKSLDFKLAGKGNTVDLRLTNEMMESLDLISDKSGSLLIGYDRSDKDLNGKVEGNRLGTYGNKKAVTQPRDFLGIEEKDLKKILNKFPIEDRKSRLERALKILAANEAAEEVVQGVDVGERS